MGIIATRAKREKRRPPVEPTAKENQNVSFAPSTGKYKEENIKIDLSKRERIVLTRIMKGMTSKEIAAELNMSVSTIKTFRSRIFKKLEVKSMHEALVIATKYHLL